MTNTESRREQEFPVVESIRPLNGAHQRPQPGLRQGDRPYWNGIREVDVAAERAAASGRLRGVDAARGFALFGMIAVHTLPLINDTTGTATVVNDLFAGKSALLFGLLAGVSMAFLTGGRHPHMGRRLARDRVSMLTRALILLVFGLALNYAPIPVENILPYYGLYYLLGIFFVGLGTRALFAWSAGLLVAAPIILHVAQVLKIGEPIYGPNLGDAISYPLTTMSTFLVTGTYPALTWMALIVLGIALGRLDLSRRVVQLRMCVWGAVVGFGTMLASDSLIFGIGGIDRLIAADPAGGRGVARTFLEGGTVPATTPLWQFADVAHGNNVVSMLTAGGLAVLTLGAFLLAYEVMPEILGPIAAAGAMTFTLYTMHVLVLAYLLVWIWPEMWTLAMTIGFIAFAVVWQTSQGRGPLEALISAASKAFARVMVRGEDELNAEEGPAKPARHRRASEN